MNASHRRLVAAACFLALTAGASQAAPSTPEEVVRAYAEAANRHDVEALLALYAPGVRKYRFPGSLASEGRDANRDKYKRDFSENPDLKVKILELSVLADKVVSHDLVTGLAGGKTSEELVVYQVEGGQISNIVYVERQLR
jgi:hypothetical protein